MNTVVESCVTTNISLTLPGGEPLVNFHGAGGEGRTIFSTSSAQHSHLHESFSRDYIHLTPWPRAPWKNITMWIVEQIPQLLRNWRWFFHGRTCQKRPSICSQGLSPIAPRGGRSGGETGSLHSQQTPSCPLGGKLASVTPFMFFWTSRIIAQYPIYAQQIVGTQGLKN